MELAGLVKISKVSGVDLKGPHNYQIEGTLCLTGHHIMVTADDGNDFYLLHKAVDTIERKQTGAYTILVLKTKDFLIYYLQIPAIEESRLVCQSIEVLSNIETVNHCFAFNFAPSFEIVENGWHAFSIREEFSWLINQGDWKISNVNADFRVCPTYPESVIVPSDVTDDIIVESARFRHQGRFPVLSYFHKETLACLLRSGQPLAGPIQRRSKGDEMLLNSFLGNRMRGFIVDTRSSLLIKQAQTKGGGIESDQCYPSWKKIDLSLERFYGLNSSFQKFIDACQDTTLSTDKWLSRVESSNWLGHVLQVLRAACRVALYLDNESYTVLVHGAEGSDSTLLVCALVQVILHPDCRTIRGFEALIDREWVQAGHPFWDRCYKSAFASTKDRHEAPVFLLFLDAVWQIWQQHSCAFEFTDNFLMLLARHAYYSDYGTFLCNNEKARAHFDVRNKTVSLWSYINQNSVMLDYLNPLYDPCKSEKRKYACWPNVSPQSLNIWQELYQGQVVDPTPIRHLRAQLMLAKERQNEAKSKAVRMRRILAGLEREAIQAGVLSSSVNGDKN